MAKEEMDKAGTIPTEEVLVSTYEEKFGSYLKLRDLFDLEILAKENKIIDEMAKEKDIQISTLYCDGACSPNPGVGGYGSIFKIGDTIKKFSKGFKNTTNNRMELLSVIEPLEDLSKDYSKLFVTVVTDSQYVSNAINQNWITNWVANNWEKSSGDRVSNIDLWKRLLTIMDKHTLQFEWIKGHNGHKENEECDKIAVIARSLSLNSLETDKEYENSLSKQ
jgi:ribonuclease HI